MLVTLRLHIRISQLARAELLRPLVLFIGIQFFWVLVTFSPNKLSFGKDQLQRVKKQLGNCCVEL